MTVDFKHDPMFIELDAETPHPLDIWQAKMEVAFPELHVSPIGTGEFRARYRSAGSKELQISDIQATPHLVERNPGVVTAKNLHYYKVSLQLLGTGEMSQGDRQLRLTPGLITVYDTARPYDLRFDEDARFLVAMFPKHALDIPTALANELTAYPLDCTTGLGAMMSDYLLGLVDNLNYFAGPSGERLARTGLNLLSTLLASEEEKLLAESHPERKSLLVEICFFINEHLADPRLDPGFIAAAHFISIRQLYNIFKETGVSVANWIKQRRLAECRRDLADPLFATLSVATIAGRWSFDEAPYFSRIFKETFGVTPSEWRRVSFASANLVA